MLDKMKKKKIIIFASIIIVIVGIISFNLIFEKVNISSDDAILIYKYDNKNIKQELNKDDSALLKSILNNKRSYHDNPSCGFTEDVSIKFNNMVFCMACDNCSVVRLNNTSKYISISKEDRKKIEKIFNKYGGTFPCV